MHTRSNTYFHELYSTQWQKSSVCLMEKGGAHKRPSRDCFENRASFFHHVHCTISLDIYKLYTQHFCSNQPKISSATRRESVRFS